MQIMIIGSLGNIQANYVLLVFRRKDLCDARPKPEACSKFQMRHTPPGRGIWWSRVELPKVSLTFSGNAIEKTAYSQTNSHSRGIWWPRAVLCKVIMTLGYPLGQADIQSDIPPSRGIWWPRAVLS